MLELLVLSSVPMVVRAGESMEALSWKAKTAAMRAVIRATIEVPELPTVVATGLSASDDGVFGVFMNLIQLQ